MGGGVSGLWLALRALRQGTPTRILSIGPFGGYASTKNQGWLHSGALYALNEAFELALACRRGTAEVQSLCRGAQPSLIAPHVKGAFVPENAQQMEAVKIRLDAAGIPFSVRAMADVRDADLLCSGNPDHDVLVTDDYAIDTQLLIRRLIAEIRRSGGEIVTAGTVDRMRHQRGLWTIDLDCGSVSSETVVLALGAGLPAFLRNHLPSVAGPEYVVTRSRVLAIGCASFNTIVVPLAPGSPTVVPIWHAGEVKGITICIPYDNEVERCYELSEGHPAMTEKTIDYCTDMLPGLRHQLQSKRPEMGMYTCQKLMLEGESGGQESARLHKVDTLTEGLYSLYSGKMSAAPVAAAACLSKLRSDGVILTADYPNVSDDDEYDEPTRISERPAISIVDRREARKGLSKSARRE
ncbi:NAD(P)/FAD-dependent oxidoreductase [Nocardia sp. NPDC057663]|uniref:NAD(P)/FAD-dependent oxidoreductase n=1 Tax=Nocardia sp. NPDC057663 TaxID=3346201 RepID=UPI00366CBC38